MRWPWGQDPAEKRIAQLEREILHELGPDWPPEFRVTGLGAGFPRWDERQAEKEAASLVDGAVRRIAARFPPNQLGLLASEMYFRPGLWRWRLVEDGRGRAVDFVLRALVARFPPPDIIPRIQARFAHLLQFPCGHEDERHPSRESGSHHPDPYFRPTLADCLDILLTLPATPASLGLLQVIVDGGFDVPVSAPCWLPPRELPPPRLYEILFAVRGGGAIPQGWIWDGGRARAYEVRAHLLGMYLPAAMDLLYRHGMLDRNLFLAAACRIPRLLQEAARGFEPYGVSFHYGRPLDPRFVAMCEEVVNEAVWRVCEERRPGDHGLLLTFEKLRGSRFLLRAAELHCDGGLGKLTYRSRFRYVFDPATMTAHRTDLETLEAVVIHLANARLEPMTPQYRDRLVEALRAFPRDTLMYLLPVAPRASAVLCEALGWEASLPIVEEIFRTGRLQGDLPLWPSELRSSPDPSYGVLDVPSLRTATERAGEAVAKRLVKLFRQSGLELSPTLMLVEAVAGWNREDVVERIAKRNQPAVRAYGALPILRGEDEVLERYLFLKRFAEESKKFGMMRHGNEKAASRAGLANLARNAGYGDATRLEWAMEARLGGMAAPGRTWDIQGYEVELTHSGREVDAVARKDGRALKSIPAAVKKSPEYGEVKEAVKQLRRQVSRMRASLEDLMAEGEPLSRREVEMLLGLATARGLITSLVWGTEDGRFGLTDEASKELIAPDGTRSPIPEQVFLAHAFHLFHAGVLGDWQREIVHRRIEQPFKQSFRELYVLTPAEENTCTFSNRFAGRLLNSGVASRLFQARGWKFDPEDVAVPYRVFPRHGLRAVFDFPDAGHILAETESVTSDRIYFERHPRATGTWAREEDWVPLKDVPPLVFSEVMRDADLVVSVAQRGEVVLSEEAFQRRGEVVRALLADLGLPGVTIEDRYARVKGKLATYRVHLGTAHIFIEPGNYLCVVPDRWGKRHEKLFLPFVEEADSKFSEVVSKILFLVNDDRIKDEHILKQIRQGGMGPQPLHA